MKVKKELTKKECISLAEKCILNSEKIVSKYEPLFLAQKCGYKYVSKSESVYDDSKLRTKKTICFIEVKLFNSEMGTSNKDGCQFKTVRLNLCEYQKINGRYKFKNKHSDIFKFIMNLYLKTLHKHGIGYLFGEHLIDLFIRFFFPSVCGEQGNKYKGKDLYTIKIVLAIIITLITCVSAGSKQAEVDILMGWWPWS